MSIRMADTDHYLDSVPDTSRILNDSAFRATLENMSLAENEEGNCGWKCFAPRWLRMCGTAKSFLFFLCSFSFVQGMVINGFVLVSITSLESRFNFSSVYSGSIAGLYDIGVLLFLIPVTYYGANAHKPRYLGLGCCLMGFGSIVYSLPHFMTGLYQYDHVSSDNTCTAQGNETGSVADCTLTREEANLTKYYGMFVLAQFLHGAGATPLYTLGVSFLDENVRPKNVSVYIGIFFAVSIVGPAIGYVIGGYFLSFWTDIDQIDQSSIDLSSSSTLWVGCWWLGFLLSGILAILLSIPLLAFPNKLPGWKKVNEERMVETHQSKTSELAMKQGFGESTKDLLISLKILMKIPPFVFICLAEGCGWGVAAGLATFAPKYMEHQFQLSKSWAAVMIGLVGVPGGFLGNFLGGVIIRCLKLDLKGIFRFCIVGTLLATLTVPLFFLRCSNSNFSGVSIPYRENMVNISSGSTAEIKLTSQCNIQCSCSSDFDLVCGSDRILYYSPCHAGCTTINQTNPQVFNDCGCLADQEKQVTAGHCTEPCLNMGIFLFLMFICLVFSFLVSVPMVSAAMRTVAESQKSFSLGVKSVITRCLGTIPAPIIFGIVIDKSCILWEETCDDDSSSCLFYNTDQMGLYLFLVSVFYCVFELLSLILALYFYKPPDSSNTIKYSLAKDKEEPMFSIKKNNNGVIELESNI